MSERDELVLDAIAGLTGAKPRGNCPFCEERTGTADRRRSLVVERETGFWHCWRCASRGVISGIEDDFVVDVARPIVRKTSAPRPSGIELPEGFYSLYEGVPSHWLDWGRAYFRDRGVTEDAARAVRVGAVLSGFYADRVVVPIYTKGVLVGWSARLVVDRGVEVPKYLYPKGMDRSTVMFNDDAIDRITSTPLLIVEGVFDALPLWPDAVAVLGKPSLGQVERLKQAQRPVCVALDGDAWREAKALALRLRNLRAGWLRLPPKTDPGKTPPDELRAAAAQAVGLRSA